MIVQMCATLVLTSGVIVQIWHRQTFLSQSHMFSRPLYAYIAHALLLFFLFENWNFPQNDCLIGLNVVHTRTHMCAGECFLWKASTLQKNILHTFRYHPEHIVCVPLALRSTYHSTWLMNPIQLHAMNKNIFRPAPSQSRFFVWDVDRSK